MDSQYGRNFYIETSSDEYPSDSSDDETEDSSKTSRPASMRKSSKIQEQEKKTEGLKNDENIIFKLLQREKTGHFSGNHRSQYNQRAFSQVPNRLRFCLKDIFPQYYLQDHIIMGLTVCGQYLISYKFYHNDNPNDDYPFNLCYTYSLYFWIYKPHEPLKRYFEVSLFDAHGVDNFKNVTMTQWTSIPHILVVHGAAENENEESYLTLVNIPKLNCLECKQNREFDTEGYFRYDLTLCIKCNLKINTKYSTTESDPKFNPYTNLICPGRIVVVANGFIHMLHFDLEINKNVPPITLHWPSLSPIYQRTFLGVEVPENYVTASPMLTQYIRGAPYSTILNTQLPPEPSNSNSNGSNELLTNSPQFATNRNEDSTSCDRKSNIVARIIADFSDIENETQTSVKRNEDSKTKNFDELVFTCRVSHSSSFSTNSVVPTTASSSPAKVSLLNHRGARNTRIVTKSLRNGVTTVDLQGSSSTASSSTNDKSNAYEFSEDTEKCEKIGTFRKRRLADKKYEFSEDNSENIVPFTKIRHSSQLLPQANRPYRNSSHFNSTGMSPSSPQSFEMPNYFHRGSPSQGFRSPCGSPVGSSIMRSPGKQTPPIFLHQKSPPPLSPTTYQQQISSVKPLNTLSPLQVSVAKRNHMDFGNMSPTTAPFLSPRREDYKVLEIPTSGFYDDEKPKCTIKFKRRFVEPDDAESVITSEEDDCISPGYHTSLPVEVHGSCRSHMQMVSHTSYQKLDCSTVIVTQHSFDLEMFTYYVINNLCRINNKIYNIFYDWSCELINVCPRSNILSCMLMAHFTARDNVPNNNSKQCLNCLRSIDCVFHRKQFECRILFTWNMESGDWNVLDYGELHEIPVKANRKLSGGDLSTIAKQQASELANNLDKMQDFSSNLRVLDSNTELSKTNIIDLDNMIELYLKRPRLSTNNN